MKTLFERMADQQEAPITIYIGGETAARLRRISAIDGREPDDLALSAVEEAARMDPRGNQVPA